MWRCGAVAVWRMREEGGIFVLCIKYQQNIIFFFIFVGSLTKMTYICNRNDLHGGIERGQTTLTLTYSRLPQDDSINVKITT